jgi:hypothetical protein
MTIPEYYELLHEIATATTEERRRIADTLKNSADNYIGDDNTATTTRQETWRDSPRML